MARAQFYGRIYTNTFEKIQLDTEEATVVFKENVEDAMSHFYAAILVFTVKAKRYFQPSKRGKYPRIVPEDKFTANGVGIFHHRHGEKYSRAYIYWAAGGYTCDGERSQET